MKFVLNVSEVKQAIIDYMRKHHELDNLLHSHINLLLVNNPVQRGRKSKDPDVDPFSKEDAAEVIIKESDGSVIKRKTKTLESVVTK